MTMILAFAVLVGLAVGSFANVAIHRLPREGLSITRPAFSFCPSCLRTLPWYENLPVVSWLFLRGRCSSCKARISLRYPLVELLVGALFAGLALRYGPQGDGWQADWGVMGVMALLVLGLVVASAVDLEHMIIPDQVSVWGMAAAPFLAYLVPDLHRGELSSLVSVEDPAGWWMAPALRAGWDLPFGAVPRAVLGVAAALALAWLCASTSRATEQRLRRLYPDEPIEGWPWGLALAAAAGVPLLTTLLPGLVAQPRFLAFCTALVGMALGGGVLYVVGLLGSLAFRTDAMGFGDVKLLGLLGAVLGWKGALLSLFVGSVVGSVVGLGIRFTTGKNTIPFGPYLAVGALVAVFWGPEVLVFFTQTYPEWVRSGMAR